MAILLGAWTTYMSNSEPLTKDKLSKKNAKKLLMKSVVLWPMLVSIFFIWMLIQDTLWDYSLIISICEIGIISILASEPRFWKLLKIVMEVLQLTLEMLKIFK